MSVDKTKILETNQKGGWAAEVTFTFQTQPVAITAATFDEAVTHIGALALGWARIGSEEPESRVVSVTAHGRPTEDSTKLLEAVTQATKEHKHNFNPS